MSELPVDGSFVVVEQLPGHGPSLFAAADYTEVQAIDIAKAASTTAARGTAYTVHRVGSPTPWEIDNSPTC